MGGHDLQLDRRRLLSWAAVGGAGTLLAACGGDKQNKGEGPIAGEKLQDSSAERPGTDVNDVVVLNSALDLEHQAVAAYTAALDVLTGENLRAARQFRDHERQHVVRLSAAIKEIGGKPSAARAKYTFPRLNSQEDVLRFATKLENTAISAYIDAVPRLNDPDLRAAGASIMANEAEHLAALNSALGLRTAPTAFVTGEASA
jgi:rubrerythrin